MKARPETTRLAIEALKRSERQIIAGNVNNNGFSSYILRSQNKRLINKLENMKWKDGTF